MVTFLAILFVLIVINAALFVFSTIGAGQKMTNLSKNISEPSTTEVYPLDLIASKYKKAI